MAEALIGCIAALTTLSKRPCMGGGVQGTRLGDDYEPGVDGDVAKALLQGALHVGRGAVGEPQGQQAQDVLQVGPLRRLACTASTALGNCVRCCRR